MDTNYTRETIRSGGPKSKPNSAVVGTTTSVVVGIPAAMLSSTVQGQCYRCGRLSRLCSVTVVFSERVLLVPCFFVMTPLSEQCLADKICFLLSKNAEETVLMLKTANKNDALGKTQVYKWFSHFKSGDNNRRQTQLFTPFNIKTDKNLAKIRAPVLEE